MPELPEVASLAGYLGERMTGHRIGGVTPVAVSVLKTYDPPPAALAGRTVTGVTRHGKWLDIDADGLHLLVHLARGGWIRWKDHLPDAPPRPGKGPLALRVAMADPPGAGFDLTEAGTKKRAAVHIVTDPSDVPAVATLGPDPLDDDFTPAVLAGLVRAGRHRIKGVLRDQNVIAGIGNAYSDEILHVARMSPYRMTTDLGDDDIAALHEAVRTTLADAVERARDLPAEDLKAHKALAMRVHGRTGQPCPVCGDTVREVSFADSSLQYCPTCQTGGRILADRRMSRLLK